MIEVEGNLVDVEGAMDNDGEGTIQCARLEDYLSTLRLLSQLDPVCNRS